MQIWVRDQDPKTPIQLVRLIDRHFTIWDAAGQNRGSPTEPYGRPPLPRGESDQPTPGPRPDGGRPRQWRLPKFDPARGPWCFHCNEFGHIAIRCPKKAAAIHLVSGPTEVQGKDRKGTRQKHGAGLWSIKNVCAQEVDPGECVKWRDHVDEMFQRTLRRSAARRPHPGSRWKDDRDGSRSGGRPGMRRTDRVRRPLPMGIDKVASPGRRGARGTDQGTDSETT